MTSGRFGWTELSQGLPMTTRLERAFASRADDLPEATRLLLAVTALDDGSDADEIVAATRLVTAVVVDVDTIQPALDANLLVLVGSRAEFRHPLVRSALRHATPLRQRQAAHAALATVLSDSHPDRAAWHRASSITAPDEQVAGELERAAAGAAARGAMASAMMWLQRAAALTPDPAARGTRLLGAAEFAFELGRHADVEQLKAQIVGLPLLPGTDPV